jgi:hypothetical protein
MENSSDPQTAGQNFFYSSPASPDTTSPNAGAAAEIGYEVLAIAVITIKLLGIPHNTLFALKGC